MMNVLFLFILLIIICSFVNGRIVSRFGDQVTGAPEWLIQQNFDKLPRFDIRDFGAIGDGVYNCTSAFDAALSTASQKGGGLIVISEGKYLIGEIKLLSNVYLWLERGGMILGSANVKDYYRYEWLASNPAVIRCINQTNTGVIGNGGIIDGQAVPLFVLDYDKSDDRFEPIQWQGLGPFEPCSDECRPRLLQFTQCHNVVVKDVLLQNSADWTSHYLGCTNVYVHNVSITGDHRFPNNDGVDVDSSINVTVKDSVISTGDDSLCPKSTQGYGPLNNVLFDNIQISSRSGAFKIGSATFEDMSNILSRNLFITGTNRGLGIQHRDGGSISNIYFENIFLQTQFAPTRWWGAAEPLSITTLPRSPGGIVGDISNIYYTNITAIAENSASFIATRGAPSIKNIYLSDIEIRLTKASVPIPGVNYISPVFDYRPSYSPDTIPVSLLNILYIDGVDNINIEGSITGIFDNNANLPYLNGGVCVDGTNQQLVKQISKKFICKIISHDH